MNHLDSTGSCAHSMFYASTLKGRTSRTGSTCHPVLIAQDYLSVGTNINKKCQLRLMIKTNSDNSCHNIAANIACHTWRQKNPHVFRDLYTKFCCPDRHEPACHRHIGLCPEKPGFKAKEEVGHDSIGGNGYQAEIIRRYRIGIQEFINESI